MGKPLGQHAEVLRADVCGCCSQLDSLYAPLNDADAVIIATGTSALPSPRWKVGCFRASQVLSPQMAASYDWGSVYVTPGRAATHLTQWTARVSRTS